MIVAVVTAQGYAAAGIEQEEKRGFVLDMNLCVITRRDQLPIPLENALLQFRSLRNRVTDEGRRQLAHRVMHRINLQDIEPPQKVAEQSAEGPTQRVARVVGRRYARRYLFAERQ